MDGYKEQNLMEIWMTAWLIKRSRWESIYSYTLDAMFRMIYFTDVQYEDLLSVLLVHKWDYYSVVHAFSYFIYNHKDLYINRER